jgi:hypothetical protein
MGVDAQSHSRIGMAKAGCYDVDRDSCEQQGCGLQIAKIMKPGMRQQLSGRNDGRSGVSEGIS